MFLCLPEELYILSAFFVSHIHSVFSSIMTNVSIKISLDDSYIL